MYISQFFILSPRGDKLVFKDYRQDAPRNTEEIFFRKYKFWDSALHPPHQSQLLQESSSCDCPPFFSDKGVHFCFTKRRGLLFVCTSLVNLSPSLTMEVLVRAVRVIKDYLGVLSEESIRKNFTLVYELLDEMLDVGVAQELNTERLRPYIFNEIVPHSSTDRSTALGERILDRLRLGELLERTKRGEAAAASVVQAPGARKNELFIDVIERLNVIFSSAGHVIASDVDGHIVMKSFLSGSPMLYLSLNEDLVVGTSPRRFASAAVDSVNFHDAADYSRFDQERLLAIRPPDGEFTLMHYKLSTTDVVQPFRLLQSFDLQSPHYAEVTLRVRADIPATTHGISVCVNVPTPVTCTAASVELGAGAVGQTHDYSAGERRVTWCIPKFAGGTEQVCKVRFSTAAPITAATRREIGPIAMQFEIPQHSVSGLTIQSLRLEERGSGYNPTKWIRNVTVANSYVFRTHGGL